MQETVLITSRIPGERDVLFPLQAVHADQDCISEQVLDISSDASFSYDYAVGERACAAMCRTDACTVPQEW
jgi:hypothetical protein